MHVHFSEHAVKARRDATCLPVSADFSVLPSWKPVWPPRVIFSSGRDESLLSEPEGWNS